MPLCEKKKLAQDLTDCLRCHRPHIPLWGQLIQYGTSNVTKKFTVGVVRSFWWRGDQWRIVTFCVLKVIVLMYNETWNSKFTERTDILDALHTQNIVRNHKRRNATYVIEYITMVW